LAIGVLILAGLADRAVQARRLFSTTHKTAIEKVRSLPESYGSWASESAEVDGALLKTSGTLAKRVLQCRDGRTGNSVWLAILVGPPGLVTDQLAEKSFRAINYAFDRTSLVRLPIKESLKIEVPGELARMDFWEQENRLPMRVWEGWFDGERWSRHDWARLRYLDREVLFKIRVWAPMIEDPLKPELDRQDVCEAFLKDALPIITRGLQLEKR
jgi:hypothetical protein